MKNKKAFTVVELVIVIAIIAILAAVLIPTFANIIKKANVSKDQQLIRNLNTALASDKAENGGKAHANMTEALEAAKKFGYEVGKINASGTDNEILWDSKNDVFCYYDADKQSVEYIPSSVPSANAPAKESTEYWCIITEKNVDKAFTTDTTTNITTLSCGRVDMKWSCYLDIVPVGVDTITTATGVDEGETTGLTTINYANTGTVQTVIICTNSASTNLNVDDASTGSVYHYGSLGSLNIIQCHTASYHENGKVAYAEIAKGRIVLESGSEIEHVHINATGNAFDTIIIEDKGARKLPSAITRDAISLESGESKLVVTVIASSGEQEEVYVYADGTTGTTEKTNQQNSEVDTALGVLVLDNGSAGEKAQTQQEKGATKAEAVADAIIAEQENTPAFKVNGAYYSSLAKAFEDLSDNATADIVLNKNITIKFDTEAYIAIKQNQNITIDLNGYFINVVATRNGASAFIKNQGTLTLKDSKAGEHGIGDGKITFLGTDPDTQDVPGYASNIISNYGNLTIKSGQYENQIQAGYASYALDTYGGANVTIDGGKFIQSAEYTYAVRMFTGTTNQTFTMNDGVITGGYAFWLQLPSEGVATKADLIINGGEFLCNGYAVYFGGSGNSVATRDYSNVSVVINGGTLNRVKLGGVSSAEKGLKVFKINGGTITELFLGSSHLKPVVSSSANLPTTYKEFHAYCYVENGKVFVEDSNGNKAEMYESPWDDKSYWEANGYTFEYDSYYQDYSIIYNGSVSSLMNE